MIFLEGAVEFFKGFGILFPGAILYSPPITETSHHLFYYILYSPPIWSDMTSPRLYQTCTTRNLRAVSQLSL